MQKTPKRKLQRPKRKLLGELEQQAISDYVAGMSNGALEEKYGVYVGTITERVRRFDATKVRRLGQKTTALTEEQEREVIQLYETGMTQRKIANALGISQAAVSLVLKRNGIKTRVGRGEHSSHWKGGRRIDCDGYVNIWLSEDDPHRGMMRKGENYVLEHRVVMARHVGRALDRHETVHHINGDRTDNRIENLQLRSGRHGRGVIHRCLDCGSSNIGSAKIK